MSICQVRVKGSACGATVKEGSSFCHRHRNHAPLCQAKNCTVAPKPVSCCDQHLTDWKYHVENPYNKNPAKTEDCSESKVRPTHCKKHRRQGYCYKDLCYRQPLSWSGHQRQSLERQRRYCKFHTKALQAEPATPKASLNLVQCSHCERSHTKNASNLCGQCSKKLCTTSGCQRLKEYGSSKCGPCLEKEGCTQCRSCNKYRRCVSKGVCKKCIPSWECKVCGSHDNVTESLCETHLGRCCQVAGCRRREPYNKNSGLEVALCLAHQKLYQCYSCRKLIFSVDRPVNFTILQRQKYRCEQCFLQKCCQVKQEGQICGSVLTPKKQGQDDQDGKVGKGTCFKHRGCSTERNHSTCIVSLCGYATDGDDAFCRGHQKGEWYEHYCKYQPSSKEDLAKIEDFGVRDLLEIAIDWQLVAAKAC